MTINYSFYIPRMSTRYGVSQIKSVFSNYLMIGQVKRVDFRDVGYGDGDQSAFVHMEVLFDTDVANEIKRVVFGKQRRSFRVYPDIVDPRASWELLKNKNPIPETRLNVHQLAENARVLTSVLVNALDRIDALEMDAREKEKEKNHRPLGVLLDELYNS